MGSVKTIYYLGYYGSDACSEREPYYANVSSKSKMDYVASALKRSGFRVKIISVLLSHKNRFFGAKTVDVDSLESVLFLPSCRNTVFRHMAFARVCAMVYLFFYLILHLRSTDSLVVYHSLSYYRPILWAKMLRRFRVLLEVEEIYSKSRVGLERFESREMQTLELANQFIFSNDILPHMFAKGKPYIVVYGNYHVHQKPNYEMPRAVSVVYAGMIDETRGAFLAAETSALLPSTYVVHILGFGPPSNIARLNAMVNQINGEAGREALVFHGEMQGQEYSNFLHQCSIGLSLLTTELGHDDYAFPSKVLTYMGHDLFVVTTRNTCITESAVADHVYFCDSTPESVAHAIGSVDLSSTNRPSDVLTSLGARFESELKALLEGK